MISYAQNGEDVVLSRVFGSKNGGFYVDVGACHPEIDSVTKHFYDRGWSGVNVEPDAKLLSLFNKERPRDINLCLALGTKRERIDFYPTEITGHGTSKVERLIDPALKAGAVRVACIPLSDLIDLYASDNPVVDFLKIDVEGSEYDVLASGDWSRHRPHVVMVEAVDPAGQPNFDSCDEFLRTKDYVFGLFDGLNRFYCCREESDRILPLLGAPANIFDCWIKSSEERYSAEINMQSNARVAAQAQIAALEMQMAEVTARADGLTLRVSEATMRAETLEIEGARAQALIAQLSGGEEALRSETAALTQEVARLGQDLHDQQTRFGEATTRAETLEIEGVRAQALIARLSRSEEALRSEVAALTNQFSRRESKLQDEIAKLKQIYIDNFRNMELFRGNLIAVIQEFAHRTNILQKNTEKSKPLVLHRVFQQRLPALADKIVLQIPTNGQVIRASQIIKITSESIPWMRRRRMLALIALRRSLLLLSGLFDAAWYVRTYPDVDAEKVDPLYHFIEYGSLELRDPGPDFSCERYLTANADVLKAGVEPVMHYLVYGCAEGRVTCVLDN